MNKKLLSVALLAIVSSVAAASLLGCPDDNKNAAPASSAKPAGSTSAATKSGGW